MALLDEGDNRAVYLTITPLTAYALRAHLFHHSAWHMLIPLHNHGEHLGLYVGTESTRL